MEDKKSTYLSTGMQRDADVEWLVVLYQVTHEQVNDVSKLR